jgi:hypothetical protein
MLRLWEDLLRLWPMLSSALASIIITAECPMVSSVCPSPLISPMTLSVSRTVLVFPDLTRRFVVLVLVVVVRLAWG